jgi:predicted extracellular nuclease
MRKQTRRLLTLCVLTTLGLLVVTSPTLVHAYTFYRIGDIQGDGFESPYQYTYLETTGIVTADYQSESKKGFFLQDPEGDGNPDTSDGIFVYNRWTDVNVGDEIHLVGKVKEYYGLTEVYYARTITILSSDNPLPDAVELNPPCDNYASDVYYESLEGMLVSVSDMKVVAGTDRFNEYAGVVEDLDIERVFQDDPAGTGELIFVDDAGGCRLQVESGWVVKGLYGPLDYSYDEYKILPARSIELEVVEHGCNLKPASLMTNTSQRILRSMLTPSMISWVNLI